MKTTVHHMQKHRSIETQDNKVRQHKKFSKKINIKKRVTASTLCLTKEKERNTMLNDLSLVTSCSYNPLSKSYLTYFLTQVISLNVLSVSQISIKIISTFYEIFSFHQINLIWPHIYLVMQQLDRRNELGKN